jgi:dTDP-4-amino-4,6-dideoxygalactose transaminase
MIPFNVPCATGNALEWVETAIRNGHISGNGPFGRQVQALLKEAYGFGPVHLTHSCTGALEMAALCCDFQAGDEVILPSFTHVGTANAFERAGARLVFADSCAGHPNVDADAVEALIGPKTKAIVVVHYAGMGCDMQRFLAIVRKHGLILIEDAAHAIGAQYAGRWLGSFGHLAAFSFHETKNITCGQGGMLVVNDLRFQAQAAVLWENGTNRAAFERGEVDQYTWVGGGSCFTLSDLNAAYLYAQLLERDRILSHRLALWRRYEKGLKTLPVDLPHVPSECSPNGHIFYLRLPDKVARDRIISRLRKRGILAVFHYIPLHSSPHFHARHGERKLIHCDAWSETIVRLPLYDSMTAAVQDQVIAAVMEGIQNIS